jgi:transposase
MCTRNWCARRGEFPADVLAPVQYGSRLKAAVVHLTHHHMMPVSRTGDLMGDLFGLPLSDATVLTTTVMTWIGCHANRGRHAFDAFGIMNEFVGTLINDGWKPYQDLTCVHALCNAYRLTFHRTEYDAILTVGEAAELCRARRLT